MLIDVSDNSQCGLQTICRSQCHTVCSMCYYQCLYSLTNIFAYIQVMLSVVFCHRLLPEYCAQAYLGHLNIGLPQFFRCPAGIAKICIHDVRETSILMGYNKHNMSSSRDIARKKFMCFLDSGVPLIFDIFLCIFRIL